ncbi:MAG: glycoside hydrolase family 3 C-terminal domain-containing protein [Deinococcales bacterium]
MPSVKHFIADGATLFGSSKRVDRERLELDRTLQNAQLDENFLNLIEEGAWTLDQGDSSISETELRERHLPSYQQAIQAGALNIMASYNSWQGLKLHEHHYLLSQVLKSELGFKGFIVTDWEGIRQLDEDYYQCVIRSVNAGIDMVMVPFDYVSFINTLTKAVEAGDVSLDRIDDAVSRILYAKASLGLFEHPRCERKLLERVGSKSHRLLAREAVRKCLTLLKNDELLPLRKDISLTIMGEAAHSIGHQCGGWTISWMGQGGPITKGTTILEGIEAAIGKDRVRFSPDAEVQGADIGLLILAEEPYAEGMGDKYSLELTPQQKALIHKARAACQKLIVLLLSGRPLIVTEELPLMDAFIAAWLFGSEGDGVADVLFGDYPFHGKLYYNWPKSMNDIPLTSESQSLFPVQAYEPSNSEPQTLSISSMSL